MRKPEYSWNEEMGVAKCVLYYKDLEFCGTAYCHPEDRDMKNKLMGQRIAEKRAILEFLRFIRDYEIKIKLDTLNHYYYGIKQSKNFNKESYEVKSLYRQIHLLEKDLVLVRQEISDTKNMIKGYIEQKEQEHNKLRKVIAGRK